jgi:hypothetical protein
MMALHEFSVRNPLPTHKVSLGSRVERSVTNSYLAFPRSFDPSNVGIQCRAELDQSELHKICRNAHPNSYDQGHGANVRVTWSYASTIPV